MTQKLNSLRQALDTRFGATLLNVQQNLGELTMVVSAQEYAAVMATLRDDPSLKFEQLIDLCGVDYSQYKNRPWEGQRFAVVAHLLSVTHNWRVRVKVFAPDDGLPAVASLTPLWAAANWYEREAFDLFGIVFEGHEDLRRILTDYGFIGHPLRKDFPVTGHVEMRYDPQTQRVIYQPVTIEARENTPRVVREDHYGGAH